MAVHDVKTYWTWDSQGGCINVEFLLDDLGLGYDDIVKTTIFLADMADFPVVNAAYGEYVDAAKPARSTVQVAALPLGVTIEPLPSD